MMKMSTYRVIIDLVTKASIDRVYLRHLYNVLAVRLPICVLKNKSRFSLLYILIIVLIQDHIHIYMMILVWWSTLIVLTLAGLMIDLILNLI